MYLEFGAGHFSHCDCTVAFFTRLDALLDPNLTLLNLGAGRGRAVLMDASPYRQKIQTLRGRVKKVSGIDIYAAVLFNPGVDEAHAIDLSGTWPLADASIDINLCDHVLEHIAHPAAFVLEIERGLKPGGWFSARIPDKWGYIGLGTRLFPNSLHVAVIKWLEPNRKAEDVFPMAYRMNSRATLDRNFHHSCWKNRTYGFNSVPD